MDDSMAQGADSALARIEMPAWKTLAGWTCAGLLALIFLVAGLWKLSDPLATATRMVQALVPRPLSLPVALLAGVFETFGAVLLLVPRWRRWGAWLCGLMLLAFIVYIGAHYQALRGEECNCFPWLKRAVGPMFFVADALMLLLAAGAWIGSRPAEGLKNALVALAAIGVFAGVLYGVTAVRQNGLAAPTPVTVDGKPYLLEEGRVFLYFFDPQCAHCDQAARHMAKFKWKDVRLVGVCTATPQYAPAFVRETGFALVLTSDLEKLRRVFEFGDPPYGVALDHGHQVQAFPFFDEKEPEASLRKLGFID